MNSVEINNTHLHCCQGNSDKVYIVRILRNQNGYHDVVSEWGRRGKTLQSQTKIAGVGAHTADEVAYKLIASKRDKGYNVIAKDIDLWDKLKEALIEQAKGHCLEGKIDSPQYKKLVAMLESNDQESQNLAKDIINVKNLK